MPTRLTVLLHEPFDSDPVVLSLCGVGFASIPSWAVSRRSFTVIRSLSQVTRCLTSLVSMIDDIAVILYAIFMWIDQLGLLLSADLMHLLLCFCRGLMGCMCLWSGLGLGLLFVGVLCRSFSMLHVLPLL